MICVSAACSVGIVAGQWYSVNVSGTYSVTMGDRGRLVVPAELRERLGLQAGVPVLLVETPEGVVLTTRAQARALLREQLGETSLVRSLLRDRRLAAATEDR